MTIRKQRTRFVSSVAMIGALAGVLIWAKLRLSTDMPRAAYADPKDAQVDSEAGAEGFPDSPKQGEALIEGEGGESGVGLKED